MMVRANGCCCPAPDVLVNVSSGQRRTVAVRLTPRSHLAGSYVDVALSPASALPAPRMRNDLRRGMSAGELETAIRALSQLDVEAETQVEAYGVCWRRLPLRHPHPAVSSEPGRYWGRNAQQNGGSTVAMFHATAMTNALGTARQFRDHAESWSRASCVVAQVGIGEGTVSSCTSILLRLLGMCRRTGRTGHRCHSASLSVRAPIFEM